MWKAVFIITLIIPTLFSVGADGQSLDLLSGTYTPDVLRNVLLSAEDWSPYPTAGAPEGWRVIPENVRLAHIARSERHLNCEWETPKATILLDYVRNGDRSRYQRISFGRREKLAELVLAECFEGKGRFLDDIVNGIWTICEETYWGVPAHLGMQNAGSGLPDVEEPTVDLFAAETGMLLAWTYYLVGDQLESVSPLLKRRIKYEVDRRILHVNYERDDFGWMGLSIGAGRRVNNWNPWICSNWLVAALLLENDPELRVRYVHKILRCLDRFLNPYPADGGCDEGPGYWTRAGASLYDCLALLYSVSNGRIDIFDKPLVREIGRYIYRVHIHDSYFVNFADASAKVIPDPNIVYEYGRRIQDEQMAGFGAYLAEMSGLGSENIRGSFGSLNRVLQTLFNLDELLAAEPEIPLLQDFWFYDLQVMVARTKGGTSEGLYLAAKGGHNDESHNHNDVGNFIVYADGLPAIIDVGVETYTAKTFSRRRYEIWTMQSSYHNLPTINGVNQKEGKDYRAVDVSYSANESKAVLSLDLSHAYPEEAAVDSWKRTISLNRGKSVVVRDRYSLSEVKKPLQTSLMTWGEPELVKQGEIVVTIPDGDRDAVKVSVSYDRRLFRADIEAIPIQDGRLSGVWGEKVHRILFTAMETKPKGEYTMTVRQR